MLSLNCSSSDVDIERNPCDQALRNGGIAINAAHFHSNQQRSSSQLSLIVSGMKDLSLDIGHPAPPEFRDTEKFLVNNRRNPVFITWLTVPSEQYNDSLFKYYLKTCQKICDTKKRNVCRSVVYMYSTISNKE